MSKYVLDCISSTTINKDIYEKCYSTNTANIFNEEKCI